MTTRSMACRRSERKRRGAGDTNEGLGFTSPNKKPSPVKPDDTPSKELSKGLSCLDINSSATKTRSGRRLNTRSTRAGAGDENAHPTVDIVVDDFSKLSSGKAKKGTTKNSTRNLFKSNVSGSDQPYDAIVGASKLDKNPIKELRFHLKKVDTRMYKVVPANSTPYQAELVDSVSEKPTVSKKGRKKEKKEPTTLFDLRNLLHTSEVPERMPCREGEFQQIHNFLSHAVSPRGTSQVMYISGVPGTGKTASTMAVLKKMVAEGKKFISVYVNAMELMEPKMLYVQVYNGITKNTKKISPSSASNKLNAMFQVAEKNRLPIILLIDELDQLVTKKQEIVYEVFNWTTLDEARITVLAIANTLDFPERMLSHRINSRMGANRMLFQPYSFDQISQIIKDRLSVFPEEVVAREAVQLASQKIAAVSGDLRKAMDILRRATEISMEKSSTKVEIAHVLDACREAASTVRVGLVCALPRHALILFKCVVNKLGTTGLDEVVFYDLYKEYCTMCRSLESIEAFHSIGAHSILLRMCSSHLLKASPGTNFMKRRISLGMDTREAQFAIKQADDLIRNETKTYIV